MTDREWRDQLRTGDEVFISGRYGSSPTADKVSRTTKTQIFIRNNSVSESSYWKKTGRLVGADAWSNSHLIMPDDSNRAKIELHTLTLKAQGKYRSVVMPKDKDGLLRFIAAMEKFQP